MAAGLNPRTDPESRDEPVHVTRAKAGDREAFSQLVRMHQAVVRAYVSAHIRGPEAADDVAQEVFLRAFRRLGAFQLPESGSIRPWLLGIARNLLLEHLRAQVKMQAQGGLGLEAALDACHLHGAQSPHDPMEIERQIEALQQCVDKLGPAASTLIQRHYFQRQTLASLAAEEHKQESALRMRLLRIREALRACIEVRVADGGGP